MQALLGVRAVIAESYERIHRGNLIGMGVLPLLFPRGRTADDLALDGTEELDVTGLEDLRTGVNRLGLRLRRADGTEERHTVDLRLDSEHELAYLRHGGTMPYIARRLTEGPTTPAE